MTVVVFAQQADTPVDVMIRELAAREVPVFRADTSWFPRELVLEAWLSTEGRWIGTAPSCLKYDLFAGFGLFRVDTPD